MFYFYVLENDKGEFYYGSTRDLKRRLIEHQAGRVRSTKGRRWFVRYYEAYQREDEARHREQKVKGDGRIKAGLKRRSGIIH